MKSVQVEKGKKLLPSGQRVYVSAVELSLHKCAVKTASRSAVVRDSVDHKSFAFVPPSAPLQVRSWPKI